MSLTTPFSVQKLQTALHAKAKESPNFRFHALYDKVYRKDVLAYAYERCQANGGAAGVDNQTFENIEAYGRERWLDELAQELKSRTYQPLPVRRVYIPKPDGKQRPSGIPTIRDRVAQTSAMLVLEPIFEADLPKEQYAYRADRSALDAVQHVHKLIKTGHGQIVEADLSSYFDSVPHAELMKSVARRVVDGAMLHLIKMWLDAPVEETGERGNKHRSTRNRDEGRGTPQGSPISPLFSNLYMRRFVLGWKKLGHEERWQAYIVNYADDLVICCRVGADKALAELRAMMSKLKLTVNEKKTRVCYLPEEKFDFLGYTFGRCYSMRKGRVYLGTTPSKKRVQRICRAISDETGRDKVWQDSKTVVEQAQSDDDWLGQLLLSGASQQSLQCGRYAHPQKAASVVMRQTQRAAAGVQTFSGGVSELCVWLGPVTTPDREPSVGEKRESFPRAGCGKTASPVR
jgi:RNA-directed DNA polymerase